jgi:MoaA/NifB/PqqE/SkfB family radical SAM enzyme
MRPLSILKALVTRRVPLYLHYGVTHRCNLRCRMCQIWSTAKSEQELDLLRIQALAKIFSRLGTSLVSLGGGEPALRPDLPQIIQAFSSQGIEVRLLTNGVWEDPPQLFNPCFIKGLRHISLSLDTVNPKLQDEICQHPGAWDKAIKSLDFFAGKLSRTKGIGIINTVISKHNFKELVKLLELAQQYHFYVSFVPLELQELEGQLLGCKENMPDFLFQEQDLPELEAVLQELIYLKKLNRPIFNSSYFLSQLIPYFKGERVRWQCLAGLSYFSVSPQGLISLCHKYKGFSLAGENIPAWSEGSWSRGEADFIKQVKALSRACQAEGGCLRPCWAEVSLALTHPGSFKEMLQLQISRFK